MSFIDEFKWCPSCHREVNYLVSLEGFFCAECGGRVRMFRSRKAARDFCSQGSILEEPSPPLLWSSRENRAKGSRRAR